MSGQDAEEWSDADEEIDYQMSVRAQKPGALLMAIGRFHVWRRDGTMPVWLAEALCSPWGRSVISNMMKVAEGVLGRPSCNG